jgi:predicted negative regulator of RcsB-dependent stress response
VDEYLSEKEQIEQIKSWWRDNGWYLVGGVALGLIGLFGYGTYQDYVDGRAEAAQALYEQVAAAVEDDDSAAIDMALAQLRDEYASSPYTDHAGLLVSRHLLIRDSARAADELRYVMTSTDDDELAMIARLRLARVLAYREEFDEALRLLDVEAPGQFAGRMNDIRGDIYLGQGDVDAARAAYAAALVAPGSELLDREYVQMKLSDLLAQRETAQQGEDE